MRNETEGKRLGQRGGDSAAVPSKALGSAGPVLNLAEPFTVWHPAPRWPVVLEEVVPVWMPALEGLAEFGCAGLTSRGWYACPNHTHTEAVI